MTPADPLLPASADQHEPEPSECQRLYAEGYCCSCHVSPPCDFCMSMTEREADVSWSYGMSGLRNLWAGRPLDWKPPANVPPPTPEPDAEAKLAAVERLLIEWADAPSGSMGELLDLVNAISRLVKS